MKTSETSWAPPVGVKVAWHAIRAPNKLTYYLNIETNEVTWDAPAMPVTVSAHSASSVVERMRGYERPASGWCFQTVLRGAGVPAARVITAADSDNEGPTLSGGAGALEPLWVEVETSAGDIYFWDAKNDVSVAALPPMAPTRSEIIF